MFCKKRGQLCILFLFKKTIVETNYFFFFLQNLLSDGTAAVMMVRVCQMCQKF